MPAVAKLVPEETVFFLCDVQTRFKNVIFGIDELVLTINKMLKVAKVLEIPVVVTEQNPKGLGNSIPDIDLPSLGPLLVATIAKGLFSMLTPEVKALLHERPHIKSVVLFGIESQVCVLQSALDLIEAGYNVHVIADGVSSSNKEEIPFALERIRQSGGYITTSESAAFQLQRDAGLPGFKLFSNVMKEEKNNAVRTSQKLLQHRSFL
ncbi:Isochorismatase-like protein [Suillus clintonianus]|uniref:Isochorismatase-like protein n=1 Tax=Suillus clintonianus TaxID=1904413 RepID=UPI001B8808AA|nr:Isochorismatase-like protein [Suillus clintonianus]KAG2148059.1 Isochorismatase-like protein [Suillus clintonianus]